MVRFHFTSYSKEKDTGLVRPFWNPAECTLLLSQRPILDKRVKKSIRPIGLATEKETLFEKQLLAISRRRPHGTLLASAGARALAADSPKSSHCVERY